MSGETSESPSSNQHSTKSDTFVNKTDPLQIENSDSNLLEIVGERKNDNEFLVKEDVDTTVLPPPAFSHKNDSDKHEGYEIEEGIFSKGVKVEFKKVGLKTKNKVILENVSGCCKPAELLALMGPSGAGKSSLLNLLASRKVMFGDAKKSGSILLNGKPFRSNDKHRIGYVMQDDIFFESLTLGETLRFYAQLRLPESMPIEKKDCKSNVNSILDALGLQKNLPTLIGGGLVRGLSGGERKRANIATELISDPAILFLDEPTSGLDSRMALHLITSLRLLAEKTNKTIITSIHQPNSKIFYTFDKLILLSYGECQYYGRIDAVVNHYQDIGLPCYKNWNMADYIIEMAKAEETVRRKIIDSCNEICYNPKNVDFSLIDEVEHDEVETEEKLSYVTSSITQLNALLRRSFVRSVTEMLTFLNFVEMLFMGVIVGLIFFQTNFDEASYIRMFYPVSTSFIQPFIVGVQAFSRESPVIIRERASAMYRLSGYYGAKTISELPIVLVRPLIFFTISYFMCGFSYSVYFIPSLIIILLLSFMGQSMGVLFSSFGFELREVSLLLSLYLTIILLVGGIFNRNIPVWLSWVRYLSPLFHGYVLLFSVQLKAFGGITCSQGQSFFPSCVAGLPKAPLSEVFELENIKTPPYASAILFLGYLLLARIFSLYFLNLSLRRPPIKSSVNIDFFAKRKKKSTKKNEIP